MADNRLRLRNWRGLALGLLALSTSVILLIICIMCSPQAPVSSKFYPNQVESYNSRQYRSSSRRILVNEYSRSRPAPKSYPPPRDNVQNHVVGEHAPLRARASPPLFKRFQSPSPHP